MKPYTKGLRNQGSGLSVVTGIPAAWALRPEA